MEMIQGIRFTAILIVANAISFALAQTVLTAILRSKTGRKNNINIYQYMWSKQGCGQKGRYRVLVLRVLFVVADAVAFALAKTILAAVLWPKVDIRKSTYRQAYTCIQIYMYAYVKRKGLGTKEMIQGLSFTSILKVAINQRLRSHRQYWPPFFGMRDEKGEITEMYANMKSYQEGVHF